MITNNGEGEPYMHYHRDGWLFDVDVTLRRPLNDKQVERLLRLADLLQRKGDYAHLPKIAPKEFDMEHYGMKLPHCGMSACAGGYAALDPWFRRRGLKIEWNPYGWGSDPDQQVMWVSYPRAENIYREMNYDCDLDVFFGDGVERDIFNNFDQVNSDDTWKRSKNGDRIRHTPHTKGAQIRRYIKQRERLHAEAAAKEAS